MDKFYQTTDKECERTVKGGARIFRIYQVLPHGGGFAQAKSVFKEAEAAGLFAAEPEETEDETKLCLVGVGPDGDRLILTRPHRCPPSQPTLEYRDAHGGTVYKARFIEEDRGVVHHHEGVP